MKNVSKCWSQCQIFSLSFSRKFWEFNRPILPIVSKNDEGRGSGGGGGAGGGGGEGAITV